MKKTNIDNILFLIFISIIPNIFVIILSFIFLLVGGVKNEIVQSLIVLPCSFILIPAIILKRRKKFKLEELGIKKITKKDFIICVSSLFILYIYLCLNYEIKIIIALSIQTFIVAVSEEFWARGILFYILRNIFNNCFNVLLISSLIFVFVTHMNRDIIENFLYRMPGALIMGIIYKKTGKLQYSILFHYVYNILGSI